MPEPSIHLNGKKSYDFEIQTNQLSDILCRGATVSSVQSTNNTLTRNQTLRDTGDYDVPHPHPYTHHYMTTSAAATPQAMSMVGSRPGSASGSGSSPGVSAGSGSIAGNNHHQLDPVFAQCISNILFLRFISHIPNFAQTNNIYAQNANYKKKKLNTI